MIDHYRQYRDEYGHGRIVSAMHATPFWFAVVIGVFIGWFLL